MQTIRPIGLMLESVHLRAAVVDDDVHFRQYNQTPIKIVEAPAQPPAPAIRQVVVRNQTRAVVDTRENPIYLLEIDKEATLACSSKLRQDDLMILDVTRKGSIWTRDKRL